MRLPELSNMNEVCACAPILSRSRSGVVSTHAFPRPATSPEHEMPISKTTKSSIFAVMNTTDSTKLRSRSRGLNTTYFFLMNSSVPRGFPGQYR